MLNYGELQKIINICIELTSEKDRNLLLSRLLDNAMELTACDAGTIYIKRSETLVFTVMKTRSKGIDCGSHGEKIELPPVQLTESNVCAYSAIHHALVNIRDVYEDDRFDFTGPKNYDRLTGYRTRSMLVVPMQNENGKLVGVMQLLNAGSSPEAGDGYFKEQDEYVLKALSSITSVLIFNMKYNADIKKQMRSFVMSFAAAVDKRTPYNGAHTRKVALYSELMAREYDVRQRELGEKIHFTDEQMEQLRLAAYLHDIGKMIIPLGVMNKETRLGGRLSDIEKRFDYIELSLERDMYKGSIDIDEYKKRTEELKDILGFVRQADSAGFMSDAELARADALDKLSYTKPDGETIMYLNEEELKALKIRRGTLTDEERRIMESHVVMTREILDEVYFNEDYAQVKIFASTHHELLDGSGYPDHLRGDQLSLETRILTAADVYDALTADDRPYKRPLSRERSFEILYSMAEAGKLDGSVIELLERAMSKLTDEDIRRKLSDTMNEHNNEIRQH